MKTMSKTTRNRAAAASLVGLLSVGGVAVAANAAQSPAANSLVTQDAEEEGSTEEDGTGQSASATSRLTEALAPLVSDGTLTQEQADTVAATLAEARGDAGGRGEGGTGGSRGHGGQGAGLEVAAEVLGLTQEELREQIADGDQTLAQIAADQDVQSQDLIDALVASATERIEAGVADGRIDDAEAQERLAEVTERVTSLVEDGLPDDARGQRGDGDNQDDDVSEEETEEGA